MAANIEDFTRDQATPLVDLALASERIQAARLAADSTNLPFVYLLSISPVYVLD
ncbi:MAG: hypothetical protein ACH34X_12745 [Thiolinea sp.]